MRPIARVHGATVTCAAALLALVAVSGAAQAQIKCWTEAGRRVCGDTPPPGAKVTTVRVPPPTEPAPPAASKDAKGARPGPLTPAEQEQEFRRRRLEAQKAAEKAEQERQEAQARRENCERAREALRALESGQRIARTDEKGERYFLDDAEIARETARARQLVAQWCGS
ncbi:MAG: DUF4124 domain-containing protein [Burkholderiales bacterium]|nr:DUF4124 domain-containing protein [Burkholderiales bacterium]